MSELSAKQRAFLDELKILDYPAWLDLHPRPPDPPTMDLCIHEAAHASAMHAFGRAIDHAVVHDGHGLVMPLAGVEDLIQETEFVPILFRPALGVKGCRLEPTSPARIYRDQELG